MQLKHTWLPASNPDSVSALKVVKAQDSYLSLSSGQQVYDAISSWWCKPLGHRHPLVINSITEQLNDFEHHIPANAYNDTIEELSTQLVSIFSTMDKVMYASDGSSAVEIAMKLSYESRVLQQTPQRSKFLALSGAYHGETIFTLSVCGIDSYKSTFANLLQENYFITEIPYVNSRFDPLWSECNFDQNKLNTFFAKIAATTTALIIEPVVQGAAGLKIISPDFLIKLIALAKKYDIHIISDEIMVGLGRLGYMSVTKEVLKHEPEFVCFAKNLSAGAIPMSAVVINQSVTNLFRQHKQVFDHSHTHSCNALGAKVALNYLKLLQDSKLLQSVQQNEMKLLELIQNLALEYTWISNPRAIGAIAACDLKLEKNIIAQVFTLGLECGIYLRPIGNTLYIMPPLNKLESEIIKIEALLVRVLEQIALRL